MVASVKMPIDRGDDRLDLVVRRATAGDVEEMVDLCLRVGEDGLFVAVEPPIDRHERRLWLEHRLDAPWTLVLVAVTAGDIIGYLTAVGSERDPAAAVQELHACVVADDGRDDQCRQGEGEDHDS